MADKDMEKLQQELANQCEKELKERYDKVFSKYNEKQKEFIKEVEDTTKWRVSANSYYVKLMCEDMNNGNCEKPSDYVKKELEWIFDGYILPDLREALFYSLDYSNEYPYSNSYYRRSFRINNYVLQNLMLIIKNFHEKCALNTDLCKVLTLDVSEKEAALINKSNSWKTYGYCEEWIAYELDNDNKKLEEILIDIINGDGEMPISREMIRGIFKSHNATMHEQLGKLLLAAKLQEGLRQAICENMDMGSEEGFVAILKVINDNNLIRFSSVKRAVGVWLGLIDSEIANLDRISEKSLDLIVECFENEETATMYLDTEDSMKIYIGLWFIAFKDMEEAIKAVERLSDTGTHHQILTAGYFCANIDKKSYEHKLAKNVIKKHSKEYDILAVYMGYFMPSWSSYSELGDFFDNEDEAVELYNILLDVYANIPKKVLEYNPCIFSWHSASLTKSSVVMRICGIARILNDEDKIDYAAGLVKECDTDERATCLKCLLSNPATKTQKEVVTALLCDKETYTRKSAKTIVSNMVIDKENYLQMEQMLRYKAADMRETLIEFLCKQDDNELEATVSRLLADKKEEKRTAGLDIIMQIMKEEDRKELSVRCLAYVEAMEKVSSKEQILIDNILPKTISAGGECERDILYTESDVYEPVIKRNSYIDDCIDFYMGYFPNSSIKESIELINDDDNTDCKKKSGILDKILSKISKISSSEKKARKELEDMCESLENLILEHLEDEYVTYGGEVCTISANSYRFKEKINDDEYDIPFLSLWQEWFNNNVNDYKKLYCLKMYLLGYTFEDEYTEAARPYVNALFGAEFDRKENYKYLSHMKMIIDRLLQGQITKETMRKLVVAMSYWYVKCLPQDKVLLPYKNKSNYYKKNIEAHFIAYRQVAEIMYFDSRDNDNYEETFKLAVEVGRKTFVRAVEYEKQESQNYYIGYNSARDRYSVVGPNYNEYHVTYSRPSVKHYIIACFKGIINENEMYEYMFREENVVDTLEFLSLIVMAVREKGRSVSKRGSGYSWQQRRKDRIVFEFLAKEAENINEEDEKLLDYCVSVYDKVIDYVLYDELRRGDTETKYSKYVNKIARIYGIDNYIAILNALGEDTLERSTYSYGNVTSKKESLSHLLSVCIPYDDEDFDIFRKKVKKTDISDMRLIEAGLYSPEWLDYVENYLNWEGFKSACYYFMAHMNEKFDDKRKAIIAKYTPISEDDLNLGAFDINWFKQAYETLGKKKFDMIYKAAKYISDGSKHTRARKYADAVLGKTSRADIESKINDKRNKDLVMSYGLLPFADENDIFERYLFIQEFIKGSKKFGSQRIASERAAADIAMSNLAINAGYSDVIRLTLQMETKLLENSKELFEDREVDEVVLRLSVDNGKVEIICTKNGKQLKSVPAKYKKDEYVIKLKDTKKRLTEQYRRTRVMFEQAMEDETVFTAEEIMNLCNNQVVGPIVKTLVYKVKTTHGDMLGFIIDGKLIGFTKKSCNKLDEYVLESDITLEKHSDYDGKMDYEYILEPDKEVVVAHPYDLYTDGHWIDYQRYLFDNHIVQSFKQVFRELYVKTEEEKGMNNSRRYSGHQIQPQKTVACLKSRRWIADVEDGLQKVYYKENIVARIYAMADWFTPADIEAPTLEWVEFSDRKSGKLLEISTIPDIIFSEVMRDVDLAVSVAHVGGVDPETSHSTVEMRAALISFTLPLFKIDNVKLNDNHAVIDGHYGSYTVNLGSGVVHKKGGIMVPILPIHSQHRGRIFLPFADEDPKTAEIISKIIMLADDKKIKDPTILDYIK